MKKEYLIYKLSEDLKEATRIENELFKKFDVKRGLRNEDGTGVLVGLTKIGNVVGYAYLDYPQLKGDFPEFNNWGMPVTTLEKSYQFDPGYGVSAEDQAHIIGVMGTLWGEAIRDINRATYMAYPRAFALAEAGWTQMKHRNWESFKQRLYPNLTNMMKKGVSVRVPFEIVDRK